MKSSLGIASLAVAAFGTAAVVAFEPQQYFPPPAPTGGMANLAIKSDPRTPLGKKWTTKMDIDVSKERRQTQPDMAPPSSGNKLHLQPYGMDHQANGKGGKEPLGYKWTTQMDKSVTRSQIE
mmetsp:Transcript_20839/g.33578  ORF Transcript_20839/g.33578 Transcript_20839/m.33578 type:complete len:122 (+) Transcript_20839:99-464(+)